MLVAPKPQFDPLPDRDQRWRYHHRGRGHPWRRRQYCGEDRRVAEPGGISISEDAWRQVQGKVGANFVDTGEQSLKNIARPVRVYRLDLVPKAATAPKASRSLARAARQIFYRRAGI